MLGRVVVHVYHCHLAVEVRLPWPDHDRPAATLAGLACISESTDAGRDCGGNMDEHIDTMEHARAGLAAWQRGDVGALADILDPDVELLWWSSTVPRPDSARPRW